MSYAQSNGSIPGDGGKRYQELASKPNSSAGNSNRSKKGRSEQSRATFCLKFAAFVFSHVGLGALVLFYTIGGAFLFKHFEGKSNSPPILNKFLPPSPGFLDDHPVEGIYSTGNESLLEKFDYFTSGFKNSLPPILFYFAVGRK